jgi:Transposase DDE domain
MRHPQCTLKASAVHAYTRHLLQESLELDSFRPVLPLPLPVVASVLLLAATWQTSITGACQLVKDPPAHRQVRDTLYACLPPRPRDLLERLLAALRQTLPDHLTAWPRVLAIDLHQRPYYGKKNTRGCTQRQRKAGTHKSFTYATLAVLDRCGRFTVGLLPTRPHMRLTTVVARLLGQADAAGVSAAYLMMDKDFYCAEVVELLQRRGVPFLMPAEKCGRKPGCGNHHLFRADCPVGWHDYTWTTRRRRMDFAAGKRRKRGAVTVAVRVCVARQAKGGKEKVLVYAAWGLQEARWSPAQVVAAYRRRFGIEAKYRQLGQGLARTSSRCERLRLLLVGVALLLGNVWAQVHEGAFSGGPAGERQLRLGRLRLATLLAGLAAVIADLFGGWVSEWPTQRPLPDKLATFQT